MNPLLWHYDYLEQWNLEYYKDVFLPIHLTGDEIAVGDEDNRAFFFIAKKDKQLWLIPSDIIQNGEIPFKVLGYAKVGVKGKAYWKIDNIKSVVIRAEQTMSYKDMILSWMDYEHLNKKCFIMWKMIADAYYSSRINVRVVTYPGWMKDSVPFSLSRLLGDCVTINKPSLGKLKYILNSSVKGIGLNEVQKIDEKERSDLSKFYEDTGDFKTMYINPSRAAQGASEQCNIQNVSTFTFSNFPDSKKTEEEQKKEIFDNIFDPKVRSRIFPLLFTGGDEDNPACLQRFGHITEKITPEQVAEITNWMRNFKFFEKNGKEIALKKGFKNKYFMQNTRWDRNFQAICVRFALFSDTQEEFDDWCKLLYICNKQYENWIETGIIPNSDIKQEKLEIVEEAIEDDYSKEKCSYCQDVGFVLRKGKIMCKNCYDGLKKSGVIE